MKNIVMTLGVVLFLVGIVGFFNNPVLGIFAVNTLHNIVHLATGALLVFFAMRSDMGAVMISKVFGIVYALVAILGFVASGTLHDLLMTNGADHILHVLLAVVFLVIGYGMKPKSAMPTMQNS